MVKVTKMAPSQILAIPLGRIQPHPKLALRFEYEVTSLEDSIRSVADESLPNGQLSPGRVVRRIGGEGYYVYVGIKRFLALKMLREETNEERFGVFNAYVDEDLSLFQMFARAKADNEEELGEREELSVLEQASAILAIKESEKPDDLNNAIGRLLGVAEKLDGEKLRKLYDVERAARSRFRLSQLESLSRIEGNEEEFYATAASAVAFDLNGVDAVEKSGDAAYCLQWFAKIFPDYKQKKAAPTFKASDDLALAAEHLEVHEKGVLVAVCPRCSGSNMIQIKGEVVVNHLSPDPTSKSERKVADNVSRVACTCSHCVKTFYVFARRLEKRKYAIAFSLSDKLREPDLMTETVELRFDFDMKVWQKIVDGKIVGRLKLEPSRP